MNEQRGSSIHTVSKRLRLGFLLPVMSLQVAKNGSYSAHEGRFVTPRWHRHRCNCSLQECHWRNTPDFSVALQVLFWQTSRTSTPRTGLPQVCGCCVIFRGTSSSLLLPLKIEPFSTNYLHHLAINPRTGGFCWYLLRNGLLDCCSWHNFVIAEQTKCLFYLLSTPYCDCSAAKLPHLKSADSRPCWKWVGYSAVPQLFNNTPYPRITMFEVIKTIFNKPVVWRTASVV